MRNLCSLFLLLFYTCLQAQQPQLDRIDHFQGTGHEMCKRMTLDNAGGYVFIGHYTDSIDLEPWNSQPMIDTGGNHTTYIARYDQTGQMLWYHLFEDGFSDVYGVCCDAQNNVYVTGCYAGNLVVDSLNNFHFTNATAGSLDILIAKYNASGSLAWVHTLPSSLAAPRNCYGANILVDNDTLVFFGYFRGQVDFDVSASSFLLQGSGTPNTASLFIAQWDTSAAFLNAVKVQSAGLSFYPNSLQVDDRNEIYIAGEAKSPFTFGPNVVGNGLTYDVYIAKFRSDLSLRWGYGFGTPGEEQTMASMIVRGDRIVIAGNNPRNADFDPGNVTHTIYGGDGFITVYDTAMNYQWGFEIGNNDNVTDGALTALDVCNSVIIIGGYFTGSIALDPGGSANLNTTSPQTAYYSSYSLNTGVFCSGEQLVSSGPSRTVIAKLLQNPMGLLYFGITFYDTFDADFSATTNTITSGICYNSNIPLPYDAGVIRYKFYDLGLPDASADQSNVQLFPNPSAGQFTICSEEPIASIVITDCTGKQVFLRNNIDRQTIGIDLAYLANGTYTIAIAGTSGGLHCQPLLIAR